jgi:hypothetical protein
MRCEERTPLAVTVAETPMHVFIDESGTFTTNGTSAPTISAVGALSVPSSLRAGLERKWAKLRPDLPHDRGEVKGRLLDERQVSEVITLLARHQVLFEATAIDMTLHPAAVVSDHKTRQAERITANLTQKHSPQIRGQVFALRRELEAMSNQLYVQSTLTFDVIARVIAHTPLYYAQRIPHELGEFHWVIDAKDRDRITPWETWWSTTILPLLEGRSLTEPLISMREADYSYFERYRAKLTPFLKNLAPRPEHDDAVDLRLLLTEHFRFSAEPEPGLEMVDILVNATRRALTGALRFAGWRDLPRLMVHRRQQYIHVSVFDQVTVPRRRPYFDVLQHFLSGGKSMVAPRFG